MSEDIADGLTVSGTDLRGQIERLRSRYPDIHRRIDVHRTECWIADHPETGTARDDFGAETDGGRGPAYIRAQRLNAEARAQGIARLLEFVRQPGGPDRRAVLDLLGGDGLLWRVAALLDIRDLDIITCDASPHMIEAAWASGVPALLQRAERLLFRPESVDAVLLAYGAHHIAPGDRLGVSMEAHRVLRPRGTFVLHDFQVGSPVDRWFAQVVDRHSLTGHQYAHYTPEEIRGHLAKAGYATYEVLEIDDPYTSTGETAEEAELRLGEYLVNMYGLRKAQDALGDQAAFLWAVEQARAIFRYPNDDGTVLESTTAYDQDAAVWRFMIPRRALVGVGRKGDR
ncbi:methyltransferase domain-containing protein [Streptomyces sp. NPDC003077]|uniref:methyltransferase domain-containing protein n=1 Tax=Streptomyces sp. NPDC003077 TaxID=3154443 RepID=UPI0033BD4797